MAARMHIQTGDRRRAAKVLKAAWQKTQHPDLAAAFADIEPSETPDARLKRFRQLLDVTPQAPEAKLLETELHLAAEDFPGARRALGTLYETHPSARSLTLMAAIERGEGASDAVVRAWLAKALTASRGPQWVCDNCGTAHAAWVPVCTHCEAFDSLSWKEHAEGDTSVSALPPEMMPLLLGGGGAAAGVPATLPDERSSSEPALDHATATDAEAERTREPETTVTLPMGEAPGEGTVRDEPPSVASRN
jgi:HemY protein